VKRGVKAERIRVEGRKGEKRGKSGSRNEVRMERGRLRV
jgi:hypothetical protein